MRHETLLLKDHFDCICSEGSLDTYVLNNYDDIDKDRTRPAILICPGGGYAMVSNRESECFAVRFLAQGYHAFVLKYSIAPARFPTQLLELAAAIALIRQNATTWHVNPDQIAVMGFSAGGHLAANLATMWNRPLLSNAFHLDSDVFAPNAMILSYPVITSGEFAHRGSFENLLGENASDEQMRELSLEYAVGSHVPQTFLWHTQEDTTVPCENSFLFASALHKYKVPFEMHVYPEGRHGLGLCGYETAAPGDMGAYSPHTADWFALCCRWLKTIFPKNMGA